MIMPAVHFAGLSYTKQNTVTSDKPRELNFTDLRFPTLHSSLCHVRCRTTRRSCRDRHISAARYSVYGLSLNFRI